MATKREPDTRAELDAAIARAARALREDPEAAIRIPPPLSDEELAEMEREDEEAQAEIDRMWSEMEQEQPELRDVSLSDLIIEDRERE